MMYIGKVPTSFANVKYYILVIFYDILDLQVLEEGILKRSRTFVDVLH